MEMEGNTCVQMLRGKVDKTWSVSKMIPSDLGTWRDTGAIIETVSPGR